MKQGLSTLSFLFFLVFFPASSFAQGVTQAEADTLFDFAEAADPGLFSPPAATQQTNVVGADWFLRFYASSEVFLAVNANGTGPFFEGDVYALGGPFGADPVFIDTLANLLAIIESLTADDDNDGVVNPEDQCADTPPGETVNAQGCSDSQLDDDNDGVSNAMDQCPDTPAGATVDANGCSPTQLDDDNDGVNNADDACADTEAGAPVNAEGCSAAQLGIMVDPADAEKLFDFAEGFDPAAFSPPAATEILMDQGISWYARTWANSGVSLRVSINGVDDLLAGNVFAFGGPFGVAGTFIDTLANLIAFIDSLPPADDDNDGVPNASDQCPDTPAGATVDATGCSQAQLDDDNDGVNNTADLCPDTPAGEPVNADGCSESQQGGGDSDNDGVPDGSDVCPDTPAGQTVNDQGCSDSQLDGDNDGVSDAADLCPDTAPGATVDANGCSSAQQDSDNDGVPNSMDQCPDTAPGAVVDANGCSTMQLDGDGDGVPNTMDQCPNTPPGESVNAQGCSESELDSDFDGVFNSVDVCPNTPLGEIVNAQGCSDSQLDTDNDGVTNDLDLCPDTAPGALVDANGCSEEQNNGGSSTYIINPGTGACAPINIPPVGMVAVFRTTSDTPEGELSFERTEEWLEVSETMIKTRDTRTTVSPLGSSESETVTTQFFDISDGLVFLVEDSTVITSTTTVPGLPPIVSMTENFSTYDPMLFSSPADSYCEGMILFFPAVIETTTITPDPFGTSPIVAMTDETTTTVVAVNEQIDVEAGSFSTVQLETVEEEGVLTTWIDIATGVLVKAEIRDTETEITATIELISLTVP